MPPENRLFTGREDLLRAVHAALSAESGTAALTQAAAHGPGGVGKTSAARAHWCGDTRDRTHPDA